MPASGCWLVRLMLVSVWLTVTLFTLLVAVSPARFVIVTWKLYVPASLKVAVVLLAALVPLSAEKVTGAGGVPVVAQV